MGYPGHHLGHFQGGRQERFQHHLEEGLPGRSRLALSCAVALGLVAEWRELHFLGLTCSGVQQGDPISPMVFASGLQDAIEQLAADSDIVQIWYLSTG